MIHPHVHIQSGISDCRRPPFTPFSPPPATGSSGRRESFPPEAIGFLPRAKGKAPPARSCFQFDLCPSLEGVQGERSPRRRPAGRLVPRPTSAWRRMRGRFQAGLGRSASRIQSASLRDVWGPRMIVGHTKGSKDQDAFVTFGMGTLVSFS